MLHAHVNARVKKICAQTRMETVRVNEGVRVGAKQEIAPLAKLRASSHREGDASGTNRCARFVRGKKGTGKNDRKRCACFVSAHKQMRAEVWEMRAEVWNRKSEQKSERKQQQNDHKQRCA